MAEKIDLQTPVVIPEVRVESAWPFELHLNTEQQFFVMRFRLNNGEAREMYIQGDEAMQLILALNKANLATKSLMRRGMEQALQRNVFKGAISGTVD